MRIRIRLAILLVGFAFMLAGPVRRQVIGWGGLWWRPWIMYRGWGATICDVHLETEAASGQRTVVDRLGALGYGAWYDTPRDIRRLKNPDEVRRQAERICSRLPEGRPLYVTARCGQDGDGWRTRLDDELVCRGRKR